MIAEIAAFILAQSPGVVVRYRLLRDVLGKSPSDPELVKAREQLNHSRWVRELAEEHHADGGWGAFHSQNTALRQKIPTTEAAVERALALGLDTAHTILQKAQEYILNLMQGRLAFSDHPEKNDRWPTGVRLFLAATLARIDPSHPALAPERELWLEITRRAFKSGTYREEDEIQAHSELTGASVRGSFLVLNGKYQLTVLGSLPGTLPKELETVLLRWLWGLPQGIGYLGVPLDPPPPARPGPLDRWLASHELLRRGFPGWSCIAQPAFDWLWDQRDEHGCWDFGPRPARTPNLPLSDSWRKRRDRQFDWTTWVLVLLRAS